MNLFSKLFVDGIKYEKDLVEDQNRYPFNIPVVNKLNELKFTKPVTFLVGENGMGKSTLIEAIAVALKLNPEGGTQNFSFKTTDTHSNLSDYIRIYKSGNNPKIKFFLRAESFYNVASEIKRLVEEDNFVSLYNSYGGNLHECSHGEAFIKLVKNRFEGDGLYILDEPEAALSPSRQMSLLCLIDDLVKKGSQFIISTHSPILLSYKNSSIYDLNNDFKETNYKDTDIYKTYKMFLDDPDRMLDILLKEGD
ncbi:MAG: AAA family ATPase [Bacilli bacterium]|nr:AAA family ATPase [Bacilli bacterium]